MGRYIPHGATDQSVFVRILATDGTAKTDVNAATGNVAMTYVREGGNATSAGNVANLASGDAAHSDGGLIHLTAGVYRADPPDAAFASGADEVAITITGDALVCVPAVHPLGTQAINVTQWAGCTTFEQGGYPAVALGNTSAHGGAAASIELDELDVNTQTNLGNLTTSLFSNISGNAANLVNVTLGNVAHGGSAATLTMASATLSGNLTAGNIAADLVGDITGNLSGSAGSVTGAVGSVTGAVGSVTGAVGSVTGNVGGSVEGNVAGSVASVTGNVTAVLGNTTHGGSGASITLGTPVESDMVRIHGSALSETTGGRLATNFGTFYDNSDADTTKIVDDVGGAGGNGTTDWTTTERQQIRYRLGLDGSTTPPSAAPTLPVTLGNNTHLGDMGNVTGLSITLGNDSITSDVLAASAVTEIQAGLATSSALTTLDGKADTLLTRVPGNITITSGRVVADATAVSGNATAADNLVSFILGNALATLPKVDIQQINGGASAADDLRTAIEAGLSTYDGGDISGNLSGSVGSVAGNVSGSVASVTGGINTAAGTITTLDALDTAQDTQHAATVTAIGNLNNVSVADILTTQMTESYATDGTAPTLAQALFLIQQKVGDFSISGTTLTVKRLDGTSTAAVYTLDDATTPTSTTRTG